MSNNCSSGKVSILECPPIGSDCVGIKSIVFNTDNTMTVTLTDGTTYTSSSLKGAKGAKGDAGEDGSLIIENEQTDIGTTTSAVEVLRTVSTDPSNNAKNLSDDGDMAVVEAIFKSAAGTPTVYPVCALRLNGTTLLGFTSIPFLSNSYNLVRILCKFSRVTSTTARVETTATIYQQGITPTTYSIQTEWEALDDLATLDFTNALNFEAVADATTATANEVISKSLSLMVIKKAQ